MTTSLSSQIMIYISAENELHAFAENSVAEITSSTSRDRISAYIMLDRITNADGQFKHLTTLYRLQPGTAPVATEDLNHNKVAVDPKAFALHLREAQIHFASTPADAPRIKLLIFWGHGGGLEMLDEQTVDMAFAQAELREFAEILSIEAENDTPWKFDIIAFDACYMAMIETMHELRDVSSIALCSSTLVDDNSFPYNDIVPALNGMGSNSNSSAAAELISRCYDRRYENRNDGKRFLFICNMGAIGQAMVCLNDLGDKLAELLLDANWGDAIRSTVRISGTGIGSVRPYAFVHEFTAYLLSGLPTGLPVVTNQDVKKRIQNLHDAVARAFSKTTTKSSSDFISPVVWTPFEKRQFLARVTSYNLLSGSKGGEGGWAKFWRTYHSLPNIE